MTDKQERLTGRKLLKALVEVAKTTLEVAPMMAVLQIIGSVISAGLPIATTFFAALTTTALADAYNGVEGAGDEVIFYVAMTALLGVSNTAWNTIQRHASELMSYKIDSTMTDRMYEHFYRIEFWRYDDKSTADRYEKAQRFAQFFPSVFGRLADIVTNFLTLIAALVALAFVNTWLALVVAIAVAPSVFVQFHLSRWMADHWRKNVETRRRAGWIEWGMLRPENMAELRLYGVVRHLLDLRLRLRDKDQKQRIDFERKFMIKQLGADLLVAAAEVGSLIWVVFEIVAHRQPIGQFLFVQQTVSRAFGSVSNFVSVVNSIDEELANLVDYQEFMNLPVANSSQSTVPEMTSEINLRNVTFRYQNSKINALDDVSMTIGKHEHVALVGENGAGKTTLLKLLTGLYPPTKGQVLVDGRDLNQLDIESWHGQLAILGQNFIRYDFATLSENVWFGDVSKKPSKARVAEALKEAEAFKFASKLPKGIDNYVDKWMESDDGGKGVDLSGGQWQRLALARNFYRNSPIVILDEPTSAIDALAEARIFQRLFKMRNKTVITVSHRLTTVRKADKIYMLEDGKIVESGTHDELVEKRGRYYRMFEDQLD